jgi:hypothetical protein
MHGQEPSFFSPIIEGIEYIARAARELFRDPVFLLGCVAILAVLAVIVCYVSVRLQFDALKPSLASWFFRAAVDATVVGIDVYVYQHILGRFRKISLTPYTITRCLGLSALFLLVEIIFEHVSHPLDALVVGAFSSPDQYLYVHQLVVWIAVAAVMIWIGYYPFLVLENDPHPIRGNYKIVRKSGLSLVIGWVVVWYVTWCLGKLIEGEIASLLAARHLREDTELYAFIIYARKFLLFVLFIPFPAATSAIGYLRGTGETKFIPRRKNPAR